MDAAALPEQPPPAIRTQPFTTYKAPLDRSHPNNAAQAKPEKSLSRSAAPSAVEVPSAADVDLEDNDGPTPRGNGLTLRVYSPPPTVSSTASYSPNPYAPKISSPLSKRSSGSSFNSLYDVSSSSDDEHIDAFFLQLKASDSVKSAAARKKESKLELVIPEADRWPSIQKFRKAVASGELSPAARLPLSPAALAKLAGTNTHTPGTDAPSLVDSTTDDRSASCPSTPDPRQSPIDEDDWDMPLQLNPLALDTLQNLSEANVYNTGQGRESAAAIALEMQDRGLNLSVVASPTPEELETPISELSVPSPGGFFASLNEAARQSWHPAAKPELPTSAVAENFYFGLAQSLREPALKATGESSNDARQAVSQQILEIKDGTESEGPPTARQEDYVRKDSIDISEVDEISVKENTFEYDDNYASKLLDTASANMNRTSLWLSAQASYISGLATPESPSFIKKYTRARHPPSKDAENIPPDLPDLQSSPESKAASARKRVRFSKHLIESRMTARSPTSPKNDSLFYHAFQHLYDGGGERDAVLYAEARSEAVDLQRTYLPHGHLSQIAGDRAIQPEPTPPPTPPISKLPERPDDAVASARKAAVALANIERQALEQIKLSVWNLEATRQLSGGTLLDKAAIALLNERAEAGEQALVLDLGGEPTADWGWAVAIEHRNAAVYTAVPTTSPLSPTNWQAHRGPRNHRAVPMENPWTLPFASETFDVVSARTLHTLLHTARKLCTPPLRQRPFAQDFPPPAAPSPNPRQRPVLNTNFAPADDDDDDDAPPLDEYALTLAELRRVLKPGGILSFSLMDAELFYPSPFSARTAARRVGSPLPMSPAAAVAASASPATDSPTAALAALSINFAEALKRRRYDPAPTTSFLPALSAAGFAPPRRAWCVLPLNHASFGRAGDLDPGDDGIGVAVGTPTCREDGRDGRANASRRALGGTRHVAGLTGLVGGLAWERWMVGLAAEMGKEGAGVVGRCGQVLGQYRRGVGVEEAAGKGAGWRCLRGWCRRGEL